MPNCSCQEFRLQREKNGGNTQRMSSVTLLHALLAFILLTNCKFGCLDTIRNLFFPSKYQFFLFGILQCIRYYDKGQRTGLILTYLYCNPLQQLPELYSKKFLCNFRVRESHSLPKLRLIVLIVLCPYMQTYETRRVSCFMYVCTQKIYKKSLKV